MSRWTLCMAAVAVLGCGARTELGVAGASGSDGGLLADAQSHADARAVTRQSAVLFGGFGDQGWLADTWMWKNGVWTQVDIPRPPARMGAAMAQLGSELILFGGQGEEHQDPVYLGDTWAWDGSFWHRQDVPGPSPRNNPAMARFDAHTLLLFGGVDAAGVLSDTWTWDGVKWTRVATTGPPARAGAAMAAVAGTVVLFGGFRENGECGSCTDYFSDTWVWTGASWVQQSVTGPSGRGASALVPSGGELVLFGGESGAHGDDKELDDTWAWDGTAWTPIAGGSPSARAGYGAASVDGQPVLFGGYRAFQVYMSDTWTWSGTSWSAASVTGPSARVGPAMATWDPGE